jgi:hypothetical protein
MHDKQIWNLVDQTDGVRPIDCKWIFNKKLDVDGNVHIFKVSDKFKVLTMKKPFRPSQC